MVKDFINKFRKGVKAGMAAIKQSNTVDDVEDGGMDTLTPQMDITALREHYEQLKRDIIEDGQAVNKDPDKYGNAPSGVAMISHRVCGRTQRNYLQCSMTFCSMVSSRARRLQRLQWILTIKCRPVLMRRIGLYVQKPCMC